MEMFSKEHGRPVLEDAVPKPPASVAEAAREKSPQESVVAAKIPDQPAKPAAAQIPVPAKKPLFWSAALNPAVDAGKSEEQDQSHVPPVLRSLHKCDACGFPVSAGRALCVECEEKKWRGQLRTPKPASKAEASKPEPQKPEPQKPESPKATDRPIIAAAPASVAPVAPLPAAKASKAAAEPRVSAVSPVPSLAVPEKPRTAAAMRRKPFRRNSC